nr:hypothetical protein GCM10020241_63230 [Streptoalloteichus tenebrarius]
MTRLRGVNGVLTTLYPVTVAPDILRKAAESIENVRSGPGGTPHLEANCITYDGQNVQLRHGCDGRWYPYTRLANGWAPAPGHSSTPEGAYFAAVKRSRKRLG